MLWSSHRLSDALVPGESQTFEIAESITEIKSVCKCGAKATVNARLDDDGNVVYSGEQVCLGRQRQVRRDVQKMLAEKESRTGKRKRVMNSILIGFTGGTGSGKTTLAQRLNEVFKNNSVIIKQDSYYKDFPDKSFEERVQINYDHPDSFDMERFTDDVRRH